MEDAEYRNPVLAKEIMDAIKDMDEEDVKSQYSTLEDAEYRNPVLAKEIMDAIKDMDEEDLKAVLGVVRRLKGKETLT